MLRAGLWRDVMGRYRWALMRSVNANLAMPIFTIGIDLANVSMV